MILAEMKNVDPQTVDPDKLTDIDDVTVNTRLPLPNVWLITWIRLEIPIAFAAAM